MSEYFPEPKYLGKVKVELDLSNYATDLKMQQELIHHLLPANSKCNVDKLDIDKRKNVPTNLCCSN